MEIESIFPPTKLDFDRYRDFFVLPNRKKFQNWIHQRNDHLISTFDEEKNNSVKKAYKHHQEILPHYINSETPYRGILLYHGLGSGKTATAIGIAEKLKVTESKQRKTIVILPAALKSNFNEEVQEWSAVDNLYKFKSKLWRFVTIDDLDLSLKYLSQRRHYPQKYIEQGKGLWIEKEYSSESGNSSRSGDSGSGNSGRSGESGNSDRSGDSDSGNSGRSGRSGDSGSGNSGRSGRSGDSGNSDRSGDSDSGNSGRSGRSGDSGDFNSFENLSKQNQALVKKQLDFLLNYDYIFIHLNSGTDPETVFREIYYKRYQEYNGTENIFDNSLLIIDEVHNFMISMTKFNSTSKRKPYYTKIMEATNLKIVALSGTPVVNDPIELVYLFNMLHGKTILNIGKFNKELTTGEFNLLANLMNNFPEINQWNFNHEKNEIRFSLHDEGQERSVRNHPSNIGAMFEDTGEKPDIKTIIEKLLDFKFRSNDWWYEDHLIFPTDNDIFKEKYIFFDKSSKKKVIKNKNDFQKKIMGLVSFYEPTSIEGNVNMKEGYPSKIEYDVPLEMTDYQFDLYKRERMNEISYSSQKKAATDKKSKNSFKMLSRQLCNVALPPIPEIPRRLENGKVMNPKYEESIKLLYPDIFSEDKLANHSPKFAKIIHTLENGKGCDGSSFVYSEFRNLGGVNPLAESLKITTRWNEFTIKKRKKKIPEDDFEYDITYDPNKYNFAIYPESSNKEKNFNERFLVHQIFNSDYEKLPIKLIEQLNKLHHTPELQNIKGGLIKTLLVTQNVSEGVSFKNVQQVHIMEPSWVTSIINQTIARAVRYESHKKLAEHFPDEDNQTVHVYKYLAKVPKKYQTKNTEGHQLGTIGKYDKNSDGILVTSDEKILNSAKLKSDLCKLFEPLLKKTSIDCGVINGEAGLCFSFGINTDNKEYAVLPDDNMGSEQTDKLVDNDLNKVSFRKASFSPFVYKGVELALLNDEEVEDFPENARRAYQHNAFIKSNGKNGELIEAGVLINDILVPSATSDWKSIMGNAK